MFCPQTSSVHKHSVSRLVFLQWAACASCLLSLSCWRREGNVILMQDRSKFINQTFCYTYYSSHCRTVADVVSPYSPFALFRPQAYFEPRPILKPKPVPNLTLNMF